MRRIFLICFVTCLVLLAHPAADALLAYRGTSAHDPGPYALAQKRLTQRVVLIIVDSWAARIMESPAWMPKLFARAQQGASGVLWAPKQTGTMEGILTLSTGTPPSGLSAIGLVSSARYEHWTVFDDVVSRGESVLFSGGPAWVALFGDRGTNNFRETGHGPRYRQDDLEGLAHLERALLSSTPPVLSVFHISETDFAAHQFGTNGAGYEEVMHFWDDTLDRFLGHILTPGITVIMTADHGNDLNGSHGGSDPIYRRVPILMWGAGIVPGLKIEMQASDMPSTIAVLLGVRAPAGALGLPAVEAMDLPADERDLIQSLAYQQAVLNNPRVAGNPALLARARRAIGQASVPDRAGGSNVADDSAGAGRVGGHPALRASMFDLEPELSPMREWKVIDWVFAALTFAAAVLFGRLAYNRVSGQTPIPVGYGVAWVIAFVLIEALLCARLWWSGAIKRELHNPHPGTRIALGLAVLAAIVIATYAVRRRAAIINWMKVHAVTCVVLLYLLSTVVRPFDTLGLLGITMVAAFAYSSSWPLGIRIAVTGAFALYFMVGSQLLWPMIGERIAARYLVGAPVAVLGVLTLALLQRRYSTESARLRYAQLSSLGLLLILLPAGGLGLTGWSSANLVPVASGLLALFCCWIRVIGRPPWWAWLGPVTVLAFWWFQRSPVLSLSLTACAIFICVALSRYRYRTDYRIGAFMLLVSMLLLLTTPSKAVSLFLLLSALIAFVMSSAANDETGPQLELGSDVIVFAALFVVACRYAIFNLFGNSNSPLLFGLQDLDIRSAYTGNSEREIVPAVLIALLKIWLAGAVLFAVLGLFRRWRQWFSAIAGMAGMFALFNIGQTSVSAALATGARSDQYDWAAFSVFVNTGIFVLAVLSFALFAAVADDAPRGEGTTAPLRHPAG